MRRYLLDTGPAQDLINDRLRIRERVKLERTNGNRVGICMPVLGELRAGVELSNDAHKNLQLLVRNTSKMVIWPYDRHAANEYGRLFAILRRKGRMIQQVDIMIAAIALTIGNCTVVSKDSDLHAIDGLDVVDWSDIG